MFSVPAQPQAIRAHLGVEPAHGVELGRFVLLDAVASNAETWFLARALRLLRGELAEVRGVRLVPPEEESSQPPKVSVDVLPWGWRHDAKAGQSCAPAPRAWRLPLRVNTPQATGVAGPQQAASQALLTRVEQHTLAAYGQYLYVVGGYTSKLYPQYSACGPYACGDTYASSYRSYMADVWRSSDGVTWEMVTDKAFTPHPAFHSITW